MQEKGSLVKCSPGKGAACPSSRMYTKRLYCLPLQRQDDCQSLPNQPIADAIKLFSSLLMERQNNLAFVIFESRIFVIKGQRAYPSGAPCRLLELYSQHFIFFITYDWAL
jgi:hypothetical protein